MNGVKARKVTDVFGMPVYTDEGFYYGDIEESVIAGNKIVGWKVRSTRNSTLSRVLGGAKGVMVPHQMVKSVGDIMIISRAAVPMKEEELMQEAE